MIHHSLTKDSQTVSWPAIRRYHTITNGWDDIGYHYGIELLEDKLGSSYEVILGRPENQRAAACPQGGMNSIAIHICCVGNFDIEKPAAEMLRILASRLLIPVMDRYKISSSKIVGHRDYNPAKSCPGNQFNLDTLRGLI